MILTEFIDAFNRGEDPARFFAPAPTGPVSDEHLVARFQWYSATTGSPNVTIYERRDLAPYFARRHSVGERWSLVSLSPPGVQYPRAHFTFTLSRSAPDFRPGESQHGQPLGTIFGGGVLNCEQRLILAFLM